MNRRRPNGTYGGVRGATSNPLLDCPLAFFAQIFAYHNKSDKYVNVFALPNAGAQQNGLKRIVFLRTRKNLINMLTHQWLLSAVRKKFKKRLNA